MVNSVREEILKNAFNRIKRIIQPLSANAFRSPTIAITREQSPAVVIFPEFDEVIKQSNDRVDHRLLIRVVSIVRGMVSITGESEADLLLVAVHNELMNDVSFGGLATGFFEVGCDWEIEDADSNADVIPAKYAIEYRTLKMDLTKKG